MNMNEEHAINYWKITMNNVQFNLHPAHTQSFPISVSKQAHTPFSPATKI